MMAFFLLLLTLVGLARSFTPTLRVQKTTIFVSSSNVNDNDIAIARIKDEYKELQEKLLEAFADKKDTPAMEAEDIAEVVLEKAADLAAFQKYKQAEMVDAADAEYRHAHGDFVQAQDLHLQSVSDATMAEKQAAMVESIDADYEDRERLRDLAVAHAARQVEHDTRELEVESQFRELEAEVKLDEAATLLQQFEQYERDLKATRKELEEFKREKAMKTWSEEKERDRQNSLLRSAKKQLHTYRQSIYVFSTNVNEKDDAQIQNEYHQVQEQVLPATSTADDFAEEILEMAADVTAFQKYKQADMLEAAEAECRRAHGDLEQAQELHRQAALDAALAEKQAAMLESIDNDYQDRERLRDLAVAHAAHQVEHDARDLEVEAQFHELEAEIKRDESAHLLQQFEEHERDLKAIIKELQVFKQDQAMETWSKEQQRAREEALLRSVKEQLNLRSQEGLND
jgi:hypothetical protein